MRPDSTSISRAWDARKILVWFVFVQLVSQIAGDAAVLTLSYIKDKDAEVGHKRSLATFCVAYNPELSKLPSATDKQKWYDFKYGGDEMDLCEDIYPPQDFSNKFLAAPRRNCSVYDQGVTALRSKAAGLILASNRVILPGQPNTTIDFPMLILKRKHMNEIEELPFSETWQISVYRIDESYTVDGSGIILIFIALVVIIVGSFRSGRHRFKMIEETHHRIANAMEPNEETAKKVGEPDRAGVSFGPVAVVVFALFMAALLVLMYYFYDYLVYFFIALFVLGATSGMYECFKPILSWTDFLACRIPMKEGSAAKCCGPDIDIRGVILLLASLTLSCVWVVYRNASFGWIFLDLLGSFLLISVLVGIQLPSLKSCTIFLCLLFVYDVFFVFITPFFTKDGQSVMVQVATGGYDPTKDSGGGQREVIPAAFKIPHIPTGALCEDLFDDTSYSLLGFGDVMVPGFLISYLRSFELVTRSKPVYSIPACVAYFVSLVVTTVALVLMRTGQPALLYIVPILLITALVTAWKRKELTTLWNGNLSALYTSCHSSQLEERLAKAESLASVQTGFLDV